MVRLVYNAVKFLHSLQPAVQAGRIPGNAVLADDQEVVLWHDVRDTVMVFGPGNHAVLDRANVGNDRLVDVLLERSCCLSAVQQGWQYSVLVSLKGITPQVFLLNEGTK